MEVKVDGGRLYAEITLRDVVERIDTSGLPLLGEIKRLYEENDRLLQEIAIRDASEQEKVIEYLSQENVDWEDKYRALVSENERLRAIAAQMVKVVECFSGPVECERMAECRKCGCDPCLYEVELRELGIDVGQ